MRKVLVPYGSPCKLSDMKAGMFVVLDCPDMVCFKTREKGFPDSYFTGDQLEECFFVKGNNTMIQPLKILDAIGSSEASIDGQIGENRKDDGRPAFPCTEKAIFPHTGIELETNHLGMSLRNYFLAHAPEHPPSWFVAKFHGPKYPEEGCEDQKELKEWKEKSNCHEEKIYFAWRSYYADKMLHERR